MPAALFVFVGFSDNCGLVFLILILFVFFLFVIIIVWIAGRRVERYRDEAQVNQADAEDDELCCREVAVIDAVIDAVVMLVIVDGWRRAATR